MSFLNSIMSSIGENGGTTTASPKPANITKKPLPTPKPSTSLTSPAQPRPANGRPTSGAESLKRKAETSDGAQRLKVPTSSTPKSQSPTPSRSKTSSPVQRTGLAPPPKASEPYRGTVRPASQPASAVGPGKSSSAAASAKPVPASASTATTAAAPKKGGYLAMLERAKAHQEAAKPFGQIKHQKTTEKERLSRKEKERQAAEAAAAAKKDPKPKMASKATVARGATSQTSRVKSPDAKKRKIEVEYKGTMRPVAAKPAYTGTMRTGDASVKRAHTGFNNGRSSKPPSYRYAEDYDDEEEDEEEDEDMDDYDSASSDMEAGMDEIDTEEMFSSRLAKKEDEEALREENELKRQKLERKRKLEALAAAQGKKKPKF
ncbi:hypothetical protein K461DRAFT_322585 [Myriangium duriaei CBS 260.36]|uniref:Chromatin SPT2 n=1 Tax=Myriangium duriaei CBS 260.36 TaxID=1168546 RepID=A0A9P4MEL3_9PEZI|nr:hypothetical protein K461DRAFT_322585 [Myriangium duriaei CBS 260.36]